MPNHSKLIAETSILALLFIFVVGCGAVIRTPPEGAVEVSIRSEGTEAGFLLWSPHADSLVVSFTPTTSEESSIVMIDTTSWQATPLIVTAPGVEDIPAIAISPDNSSLLFRAVSSNTFRPGLWMVDIADRSSTPTYFNKGVFATWTNDESITIVERTSIGKSTVSLYSNSGVLERVLINSIDLVIDEIEWSSDGHRLLMAARTSLASPTQDIYIFDEETGQISQLTFGETSLYPTWAPAPNVIAYVYVDKKNVTNPYLLHLVFLESGCDIEMAGTDGIGDPAFSPDGRYMGFIWEGSVYVIDFQQSFGDLILSKSEGCE